MSPAITYWSPSHWSCLVSCLTHIWPSMSMSTTLVERHSTTCEPTAHPVVIYRWNGSNCCLCGCPLSTRLLQFTRRWDVRFQFCQASAGSELTSQNSHLYQEARSHNTSFETTALAASVTAGHLQDGDANIQVTEHWSARTPVGPAQWLHTVMSTSIIWPPTAVPANWQPSVRQLHFQRNHASHLEQFTNYHSNSNHYQHFSTTHQDSSFLQHHRHRLTVTIRAYNSNFCFDIWRVTNTDYLLTSVSYLSWLDAIRNLS